MFSRKTAAIVVPAFLFLLAIPLSALEQQERVIAGSPNDSLEVRHLVLRGTNEEIGRALARIVIERFETEPHPSRDPLRTRAQRKYIEKNYPILYDRIRGVADAYGHDVGDDSWVNSQLWFTDFRAGCSIVHLPASTTADGKSVVSRDYDYSTGSLTFGALAPGMLHPTSRPFLIEMHPDRGYASLAMTAYDLLSGALDGINSEGLTVALAMDDEMFTQAKIEPTFSTAPGLGVLQTVRMLLDTCANVEEAKEALLMTKQYYEYIPVHYLVADRFGKSFVWEYGESHNKEYIIENPGKPLVMTNYTLHKHMDGDNPPSVETSKATCKRYAYLAEHLAVAPGTMTEEFIRATHSKVDAAAPSAAEKRPPIRTFWHALYYPEERRVKFSYYLRDEPLPDGKVKIIRSDYVEFKLAPTETPSATNISSVAAPPKETATQPAPPPQAADASEEALVAQLKSAGATVKVEKGHVTQLGFAKDSNPEPLLQLLGRLPQLKVLQLGDTQVTDGSIGAIRELSQLTHLGVRGTTIGNRGLVHIANLKKLTGLNVADTKITDAGMVQIAVLTRLETINLSNTAITDTGLAQIADLTGITGLNLSGTKITDAGLRHLDKMGRLTKLNLSKTGVTAEGLSKAKKFLPFWAIITYDK